MYEVSRTTSKLEMVESVPLGGGFTKKQAEEAQEMIITGTSFEDPGPDYCVYTLKKNDGSIIATTRSLGY